MKKIPKGSFGYLDGKKREEIIKTIVGFLLVAAVFFLGYSQTHTRKNLLTVVAVVGCLPACKALVGVITVFPYKSLKKEMADELADKAAHITLLFDLLVSSREKIIHIDCMCISKKAILGYMSGKNPDTKYAAEYLRRILRQNGVQADTVKMFTDFGAFAAGAAELDSAAVKAGKTADEAQEVRAERTIKSFSI